MRNHARFAMAGVLASVLVAALPDAALGQAAGAGARCRRVQLTGTIVVTPAPKPDFRGVIIASEGAFKMDLIFPEKGGEVRYQQNTVELTRLRSHSYGGARDCTNTLPAAAMEKRPFTMWATLGVDEVVAEDANQKVKSISDQFDMILKTVPSFPAFTYTALCEGGRPGQVSDYGTALTQLLQIFNRTQYSGSVKLNAFGEKRQLPNVALFGSMKASAEWEVLETLVPCANFQYR